MCSEYKGFQKHAWYTCCKSTTKKKLDAIVLSRYYDTWCAIGSYVLLRPWTPTETHWENQRVPPVMHKPEIKIEVEEEI